MHPKDKKREGSVVEVVSLTRVVVEAFLCCSDCPLFVATVVRVGLLLPNGVRDFDPLVDGLVSTLPPDESEFSEASLDSVSCEMGEELWLATEDD